MNCIKCKQPIPEGRLKALPGTKTCTKCSTTGTYKAITTLNGEGEDTWNDIKLVSSEEYEEYEKNK